MGEKMPGLKGASAEFIPCEGRKEKGGSLVLDGLLGIVHL